MCRNVNKIFAKVKFEFGRIWPNGNGWRSQHDQILFFKLLEKNGQALVHRLHLFAERLLQRAGNFLDGAPAVEQLPRRAADF